MSESSTSELVVSDLVRRIDQGELPREALMVAARGLLPLSQDELIEVLIAVCEQEDPEISGTARASLQDLPTEARIQFASSQSIPATLLDRLSHAVDEQAVLEAVVRNRNSSDQTIVAIARSASPKLQEAIVINQARILRCPEILDALLENPRVSGDVRRRVAETREEFFEKEQARVDRRRKLEEEAEEEARLDAEQQAELDALLAQAEEEGEPAVPTLRAPDREPQTEEEEVQKSVWSRILAMTVSEKVQRAFKGSRTERSILIQDRNKLVCSAVVKNPRVSDSEAEQFAAMRNVEAEVLRLIGNNRDWTRKYSVVINLVRNPKAPIGVVLPLLPRLMNRDLRSLSIDRNVSEAVRVSARKLFLAKTQGFNSK